MSDYLEMNLEQLQKEHAELLAFNEKLDRERNGYRKDAQKYAKKVQMIERLFVGVLQGIFAVFITLAV